MTSEGLAPIIAVVQLSDIHFKDEEHPVLGRVGFIVSAIQSLMQPISTVYITLIGDIAFSGQASEYKLADEFIRNLVERFAQVLPGVPVSILMVPGNHDCNLAHDPDIREFSLLEKKLPNLDLGGVILSQSLAVQEEFFSFAAGFGQSHSTSQDKLSKRIEAKAADTFRVGFSLYNTAWLSKNPEEPGKLYVPTAGFLSPDVPADVEIALLHHPINWLEPNNMVAFRQHIAQSTDLLLVGHQHQLATYSYQDDNEASFDVIEGLAMHDPKAALNGFHIVLFALAEERWKKCTFTWGGSDYVPGSEHHWQSFRRNKALIDQGFLNTPEFKEYLIDPGVAFTHSGTKRVLLPDIFVYPELRQRDMQRKIEAAKPSSTLVHSQDVFDWVSANKQVVVMGEDKAGKTSLAKMLYRDLQRHHNLVPLFVTPDDVDTFKPGELQSFVEAPYNRQYGPTNIHSYLQLPPSRRALIVDDFHLSRLNEVAKANFILHAEPFFDVIVVVIDEAFDLACAVGQCGQVPLLAKYRQFRIEEMGHQLKGKLISQWVGLGLDAWTDEAETFQKIVEKEKVIESLLCRRMLPSHPIIVLGLLQSLEASPSANANTGSFGELYQRLITDRLLLVAKKPSDVGTWYTFLSRLAFYMFAENKTRLNQVEFRAAYERYYAAFKIYFNPEKLIEDFVGAQILDEANGLIGFKYRDFYHFFVARYFADNIHDSKEAWELRGRLQHMANRVYFEEYARILVFFLYQEKDSELIEDLLKNARAVYANVKPCDLDEDTRFLSDLYISPPGPIEIPDADAIGNRDAYRAKMDAQDRASPERFEGEKLAYDETLNDFIKINIAMKTMYILGQVLRAFPGTIKQDVKTEIAKQCYLLGLRVLGFVVNTVYTHTDELRSYFAALIKEQRAVVRLSEVPTSAEEVILHLMDGWAFGIVKVISSSVGLAELEATYADVASQIGDSLSVKMVDLSVRLDHFYAFPAQQVATVFEETKKNRFSRNVLRDLVVHHLTLFKSTNAIRQEYGKLLDIKVSAPSVVQKQLPKPVE